MTQIPNAELLLTVLLVQQSLFGLIWLLAARLRLARRPALHGAAMSWLIAGALSLILLRGQAQPWLTVGVGNGLAIAAFVGLRRGIQFFARLPINDREHALLLALGALSALGTAVADVNLHPAVLLAAAVITWTLARAALEIHGALVTEFGRAAATWCAAPMAALALLCLVRAVASLFYPAGFQQYLQQPGGEGVAAAFVTLVIGLLLHAKLTAMVLLRLVRRLRYQLDHDMLTGLLSRRPMEQQLLAEAQRQQRLGRSFALLSVDIDHFKQINDRWGHAAGDAVLKRVAETLRACARDVDSVARMGGEEFQVLLPAADLAGAEGVAQRLLDKVRSRHHPETEGTPVTISIGLAVMVDRTESMQALQRRLDQALYRAKAAGRDRIEHAAPAEVRAFTDTADGPDRSARSDNRACLI